MSLSSVRPGIELTTYGATGLSIEQGNFDSNAWVAIPGKPPSPVSFRAEGGAFVVVGARESRVHGEGEQSVSRVSRPPGKAMYVASTADRQWLRIEQRKLYLRSWEKSDYVFEKLWGLVCDPRNLRCAFARVARNRGRNTPGVDKVTVKGIAARGVDEFLDQVRRDVRSRAFRPSPVRRVMIPKAGKPGKYRPLGIPTVADRVVQAAMKNILEPIFEAGFFPNSYGFRPCRGAHAALEHLRLLLMPKPAFRPKQDRQCAYQVAIEGDIRDCFDQIDHHGLMNRIRLKVMDRKLNRLIVQFLKAGVMSEGRFLRTETGSPQGGILSPLLANIALSVIEERYARQCWPRQQPTFLSDERKIKTRAFNARQRDRQRGLPVIIPVRYADDCAPRRRVEEISMMF